ncbi:MAG: membrane dipeptidase [Dehalococcoidia bacterium]|nr:membrane dipeptidase [Dehalococcoidia bacterium]
MPAVHRHRRAQREQLTDDALKLIAEGGGVIGANAIPSFFPKGFDTTVSDYVDAIEDLVEQVGIDHLGLGTDYTQDQPKEFFDWLFSQQGTKAREAPLGFPDPALHPIGVETPVAPGAGVPRLRRRKHRQGAGRQLAAAVREGVGRVEGRLRFPSSASAW